MLKTPKIAILAVFILFLSCNNKSSEDKKSEKIEKLKKEFEKKLANIKDSTLKDVIRENAIGYVFTNMDDFFSLDDKKYDGSVSYQDNPYETISYYGNLNNFMENYKKGIFVSPSPFKEFKLKSPVENPFKSSTELLSLVNEKGDIYPIIKENDVDTSSTKTQVYIQETFKEIKVLFPSVQRNDANFYESEAFNNFAKTIKNARIKVTTSIPSKISKIAFGHNETGKEKTMDSMEVKLYAINDNKISLKINNKKKNKEEDDFKVYTKDKSGQYLSSGSSSTEMEDAKDFYTKRLAMLFKEKNYDQKVKAKYDKIDEAFANEEHSITYQVSYKGIPDSIYIYIPTQNQEKVDTVYAPIVAEDDPEIGLKILATIYGGQEYDETNLEMKPENIQDEIKTVDGDALMEKDPYVKISFPEKYLSNHFIDVFDRIESVKDIKAYDYHFFGLFKIEIPLVDSSGKNANDPKKLYEFNTNWLKFNYEGLYPKIPRLVKGSVKVKLAKIGKQKFSVDRLPMGIKSNGNQIIVENEYYNQLSIQKSDIYIQASDQTGHLLQNIKSDRNNNYDATFNFYGKPTNIILYQVNGVDTVLYNFEKKLPEYNIKEQKKEVSDNAPKKKKRPVLFSNLFA